MRLTWQQLEAHLWDTANILRENEHHAISARARCASFH